uniref:Tyrosine specific protein phosphatases domain-containing protein n=1 Tax=Solibacter usitatus (strain Ellin6076) TaxID=234267 RepID=Q023G4_SOLUE
MRLDPTDEAAIEDKRREIKLAMGALGREIRRGNNDELVYWIIPGALACAHRPLRYHPQYGASRKPLPQDATPLIEEWVELIKVEGINSILSLWHEGDSACYRSLTLGDGDLLAYFKAQGFTIAHHPYEDPAHKHTPPGEARKTLERIREAALKSYDELPKPVLIQCSAGEDRSAPVAAYIHAKRTMKD